MQILIVSGFLGAGKTSFIKAMARATERSFVIVENEFAEFGIDGPLLMADAEDRRETAGTAADLEIRELSEGCICCSGKLDFSASVLTIANSLDPDYLLVEPSGVALTGRILQNLRPICYERIGILTPVTILDSRHYRDSRRDFPEYFNDQIKHARHLVLSKSERLSKREFLEILDDLHLANEVRYATKHYSGWSKEEWLCLLEEELIWDEREAISSNVGYGAKRAETVRPARRRMLFSPEEDQDIVKKNRSGESTVPPYHFRMAKREKKTLASIGELENIGFNPFVLQTPGELVLLLETLITGRFGHVIRSKGYCCCGENWYRYDLVDGLYTIGGCPAMEDTRAVVIGRGLNRDAIRRMFCRDRFCS